MASRAMTKIDSNVKLVAECFLKHKVLGEGTYRLVFQVIEAHDDCDKVSRIQAHLLAQMPHGYKVLCCPSWTLVLNGKVASLLPIRMRMLPVKMHTWLPLIPSVPDAEVADRLPRDLGELKTTNLEETNATSMQLVVWYYTGKPLSETTTNGEIHMEMSGEIYSRHYNNRVTCSLKKRQCQPSKNYILK